MRGRRSIFIELTSLLDVVLIMLFMLLSGAGSEAALARERQAEAEAALESERAAYAAVAEEYGLLKRASISIGTVEENSIVITVSLGGAGEPRTVLVELEGEPQAEIAFNWGNGNYVRNALRAELSAVMGEDDEVPVFIVFQYDGERVYQSDYKLIASVIQNLRGRGNLYCIEYDGGIENEGE